MKKNIFIILAVMTLVLMPISVSAKAGDDILLNRRHRITKLERNTQKQVNKIKNRGERKIKRTANLLESLIDKVSNSRKIDSQRKKQLIEEIKMDLDQLKYLQLKLKTESSKNQIESLIKAIPSRGSILGKYQPLVK